MAIYRCFLSTDMTMRAMLLCDVFDDIFILKNFLEFQYLGAFFFLLHFVIQNKKK